MSYLRTNYRISGKELDYDAIGGGVVAGSWGGGAGTNRGFGGFIMGSFNSTVASTIHPISAYGAMSEYFGDGEFGSGYKIFPLMVKNASVPYGGTASVGYEFHWSMSGSIFWVMGVKKSLISITGTGLDAATNAVPAASLFASNESAHFVWAGWIVSGP